MGAHRRVVVGGDEHRLAGRRLGLTRRDDQSHVVQRPARTIMLSMKPILHLADGMAEPLRTHAALCTVNTHSIQYMCSVRMMAWDGCIHVWHMVGFRRGPCARSH